MQSNILVNIFIFFSYLIAESVKQVEGDYHLDEDQGLGTDKHVAKPIDDDEHKDSRRA